jgi:hypothetical protein
MYQILVSMSFQCINWPILVYLIKNIINMITDNVMMYLPVGDLSEQSLLRCKYVFSLSTC